MKPCQNVLTNELLSLLERSKAFTNNHFAQVELDAYFSTLIYVFEHLNHSKYLPILKEKCIDRFLMQNNGVYLMEDNKMMLAHLYFLWSKGDGTFSGNKMQGLAVLLLEVMEGFTDEELQILVKKITPLYMNEGV